MTFKELLEILEAKTHIDLYYSRNKEWTRDSEIIAASGIAYSFLNTFDDRYKDREIIFMYNEVCDYKDMPDYLKKTLPDCTLHICLYIPLEYDGDGNKKYISCIEKMLEIERCKNE